jgi:S1-C subfamily serine protease
VHLPDLEFVVTHIVTKGFSPGRIQSPLARPNYLRTRLDLVMWPVAANLSGCQIWAKEYFAMVEPTNPLVALSDTTAKLVEGAASSIVSVHGGSRWHSSGIHWRSGIIVTAEEVLERDENIQLTLPGWQTIDASLVGRDPSTDVAVLRFQPDGLPTAASASASLRAGDAIFAVGSHEGMALAAFGIVALAGGAWRSSRGGTIDNFIRLDLALNPVAEGGALIDVQGRVLGMTVLGPRRRALAIPTSTIERAVDSFWPEAMYFVVI